MRDKHLIKTLTFIIGLWALLLPLLAEEPFGRNMFMLSNINTDAGLSSARVCSIVEAEDGAMWVSTKRGVDRYNGEQVKNYVLPTLMPFSDACGRKIKLVKDYHQNIYAYDNKGKVYIYDKVVDAFIERCNLEKIFDESVVLNELLVDEQGRFWMAIDRGVYVWTPTSTPKAKKERQNPYGHKGVYVLQNTYVSHIRFVGHQLLVGSPSGIFVCNRNQALSTHGKHQPRLVLRGYSALSSYHDAKAHKIWLGTFHRGIIILDDRNWQLIDEPALSSLSLLPVRAIIPYDERTMLMGVDGEGVFAFDKQTHKAWLLLNTDGRPENVLMGNGVYALCKDRLGDLWIGSYSGGVDLAVPMKHTLSFVRHENYNSQSIINNSVNDVFLSQDGKIWYATDKGVSIYDDHTQRWQHGLHNKVTLTLCQGPGAHVLVGTYGNGVYEVSADGRSKQVYSVANGTLKTDYVYNLFRDSDGGLWIGCLDGDLVHLSPTSGKHAATHKATTYLPIKEVQAITESTDKRHIAVGTTHCCYLIDKYTHQVSRFFYPTPHQEPDINYFVNALVFQDAQNIWIATDGGGLYLYDMRHHKVTNYNTTQQLPSNTVYALTKTPDGKLWMSTDKGLAFLQNGKVTDLNFFNGLECEYKRMAVTHAKDGSLIFGSSNGAVILSPQFAKGLDYHAPLRLTEIEVEGINLTEAQEREAWNAHLFEMLQAGKVHLSHNENTLVVSFESINYQYQHDIQYQYYLKGFDHQWSQPSDMQQARFANLPPGHYTLHVKAIGRSSGRVLDEASINIIIAQPWWNTWWAWAFYLIILGSIAYLGWNYYKERLQRKYYDEKINFFVNTAHNIRTPLSLVLTPLADLAKDHTLTAKSRDYLEIAQRNGNNLLRMVSELLDFQKIDHSKRKVHQQQVNVHIFLRTLIDKFATMAQEKQVQLQLLSCPQVMITSNLSMLDLIFENLLSNAIKYTGAGGRVSVSAALCSNNQQICIQVSDTGIGIPSAEKKQIYKSFYRASNAVQTEEMGSGLGLMLTRQLVQRLNGKLTFESEEGKGTTFAITFCVSEHATAATEEKEIEQKPITQKKTTEQTEQTATTEEATQQDVLLFVDDNADLRQYISMAFSDRYHVITVENGEAALTYLRENGQCDIVVSDVMMPGMQGDELCHIIKEDENLSWLPVILLTAKVGRDFMIEGLGLGADDYIAKPFDADILASKIDSMLKNRRRMSRYYMQRSLAMARQEVEQTITEQEKEEAKADERKKDKGENNEENNEDSNEPTLNPQDQAFVERATQLVLDNLSNTDFNIDRLCRELAMSRTLCYGKLKTLTGQSPQDFIRLIRLEQAALFLRQGQSVLDVSIKAGFVNVKYFSTVFKKQFGVSPSKYEGLNNNTNR